MTERSLEQDFVHYRETGSVRSLARVFDECAPELVLIAGHLAPGAVDPEDLLQATFVDAIQNADKYDASRPLKPWLIGILIHCGQRERKRGRRVVDINRLPTRESIGPDTIAEAQEFGERFEEALQGLPTGYRQVLTLRLVHGLANTEIAHALCCPPSTVTTRVQRGLEMLRRALPAGFTLATLVALLSERGLAMVRREVLQHARFHPIVGATTAEAVKFSASAKAVAALVLATLATVSWALFGNATETQAAVTRVAATDRTPPGYELAEATVDRENRQALPPLDNEELHPAEDSVPTAQRTDGQEVPDCLITGHVVDLDGLPIEGAKILANRTGSAVRIQITQSAHDGSFSFRAQSPDIFWAELPGFQPSPFRFVPAGDGEHHIDLALTDQGYELRGRVRLPNGSAAAFATVHVATDGSMPRVNRNGVWIMPRPSQLVHCNGDGEFFFDSLPAGEHPVIAKLDGFGAVVRTVEVKADMPQWLDLQVRTGAQLHGRIVDASNNPIQGVKLRVAQDATERFGFDAAIANALTRTAVTGTDGYYTLKNISEGRFEIMTIRRGYHSAKIGLEFADGGTRHWNHVLNRSSFLTGTLRDAAGATLQGWTLSAGNADNANHARIQATTDAEGVFHLEGLSKTAYDIVLTPRPTGERTLPWQTLHDIHPSERAIELRLAYTRADAATLTGRVLTDIGTPLAGAEILLRGLDWPGPISLHSQPDGTFTTAGLMPGGYKISFGHANFGITEHGVHFVKSAETLNLGAFQFAPKGQIRVSLSPDFEGPLGTVEMYFTEVEGANGSGIYDHGPDTTTWLPAGTYQLHLSGSHIQATSNVVRIEANKTESVVIPVTRANTVDFVFVPPPQQLTRRWQDSLRIRILNDEEVPVYDRVHSVDCVDGWKWSRALAAGDYRLEVESFRGFKLVAAISVPEGEDPYPLTLDLGR